MTDVKKQQQPFLRALRKHAVSAEVMHLDHYRITGGMAVQTDYIILVQPDVTMQTAESSFEPFLMSKTYSAFRTFCQELQHAATAVTVTTSNVQLSETAGKVARYCEAATRMVESQRQQYVEKVSYGHVQALAKERSSIINEVLAATFACFPTDTTSTKTVSDVFVRDVSLMVETFFLTDHCSFKEMTKTTRERKKKLEAAQAASAADRQPQNGGGGGGGNPFVSLLSAFDLSKKSKQQQSPKRQSPQKGSGASEATSTPASPSAAAEGLTASGTRVIPLTHRDRRSDETRAHDQAELDNKKDGDNFVVVMEDYGLATTAVTEAEVVLRSNPYLAGFGLGALAILILTRAASIEIQMHADWQLLALFAAFCVGYHLPRQARRSQSTQTATVAAQSKKKRASSLLPTPQQQLSDLTGRKLIRRTLRSSMKVGKPAAAAASSTKSDKPDVAKTASAATAKTDEDPAVSPPEFYVEEIIEGDADDTEEDLGKPMSEFPEGAELGSLTNCWGHSNPKDFHVRGPNYLKDKKKVPSGDFLFRLRGVDLLLTDTCPENVGSNPALLNGTVRDVPTFLINFRMPWGVLVMYYEIPEKFVPYLKAGYDDGPTDKGKLEAELKKMTPGERCAGRFLMSDTKYKNDAFKIVPVIVKGPWVVKQVVQGKPALIGKKVPISYEYEPASGDKALYWEADLDIAASSAARSILSLVRSYTQVLTLDLGFVVQGNKDDELPEQMLVGGRLHGVNPLTAPSYPPTYEQFLKVSTAAGAGDV